MITLPYFGLLIVSLVIYWLIPRQWLRNIILIVASYAFLYIVDKWSIAVVSGLTLFSYLFGHLIQRYPKKAYIHAIGVIGVLAALIVFKYLGFLTGIINSLSSFVIGLPSFEIKKLLLPLGISYIVFKHISYLTDIKWGLVKSGRFIDFLLYSSLFTIFVAGPIERFERFKPQVELHRIPFSWNNIDYGFMRIVFGLFKKLVLANWIGYFINPVWQNPNHYSPGIGALGLIGFSCQIYFDFSGYSDIAIGSSRLFGIKIMENFNYPYLAPNISQFWRRWHISLSDWIRDYLFFPLSRIISKKIWRVFFVPVIAMSLCGLWHGAAWHFVIWGIWHGVGLAFFQSWNIGKRKRKNAATPSVAKLSAVLSVFVTFVFTTLGWCIFSNSGYSILLTIWKPNAYLAFILSIAFVISILYFASRRCWSRYSYRIVAVYILLFTLLLYCRVNTGFIYANF